MAGGGGQSLGIVRLASVRLRRRFTFALAVGVGLAAAVAVAGATSLVQSVAAESALQATLRGLGSGALLDFQRTDIETEDAYQRFQSAATGDVRRDMGSRYIERSRYAESRDFQTAQLNGVPLPIDVVGPVRLVYYEGLRDHVTLVSGAWPAQPVAAGTFAVTISETAAATQRLKTGDLFCVQLLNHTRSVGCTRVAAVWRPKDASEPFWGIQGVRDDYLELDRSQLFEALNEWAPDNRATTVHAVFAPLLAAFHAGEMDRIQAGFRQLRFQYTISQPNGDVATQTDTALNSLVARSLVAQYAIQLVAAQMLLVALFYLALVAMHSLDQQRQLFATWRSRGWSWAGIWRLQMLEFSAVACVAAPAGLGAAWLLAAGVTRAVYGGVVTAPPLLAPAQAWPVVGVLAIALGVLGYSVFTAARRELLEVRRHTSRPPTRPWWRWRNADIVVGLLSIPLLLLTRTLGQSGLRADLLQGPGPAAVAARGGPIDQLPAGTPMDQPIAAAIAPALTSVSLLIPTIALTLIALAALRLLPAVASALAVLRRGPDQRLASWQLSRHPLQHSRLALLLAMAIALGVFSGTYATTETTNAADRAAYAAGADLRLAFHDSDSPPAVDQTLRPLRGISASSAVWRGIAGAGHSVLAGSLLAVDPYSFQQVAWSRPDFSKESSSTLIHRLVERDPTGLALPGRPTRAGVWAFSTGVSAELTVRITDADGRACDCDLGSLDQPGWRYLETPIRIRGMRYPLKLRELALTAASSGKKGEIALSDLGVAGAGAQPVVVEAFDTRNTFGGATPFPNNLNLGAIPGWWQTAPVTGRTLDFLRSSSDHPRGDRLTTSLRVAPGDGTVLLRPPTTREAIPVLAPAAFLQLIGVGVGVLFPLNVDGFNMLVRVVGLTDHFPTLYPEQAPFIVAPRDAFLSQLAYTGHPRAWPNEAWLHVDPAQTGPDTAALRQDRVAVAQVWSRAELDAATRSDPEQLALLSNLLIGFLAALALAAVAFVVHFLVLTRGRQADYAILQANGMSQRQIRRSLGAEQLALLAFSVVAGSAIGLVLAWVLLPAIQLGTDLVQVDPPTVVALNPVVAGGSVLVVAVAAWLGGAASSRLAGRFQLMDELRLLG